MPVYGDGTQSRCFCHVKDVVRALCELMSRDDVSGQVFSVGSTEEISILDLAHRVRDAADSESEVSLVPYEEAYEPGFEDMPRRVPDLARIQRVLGWSPTRDLDEILGDVIKSERQSGLEISGAKLACQRTTIVADLSG